jgi:hypothetical protein
MARKTTSTSSTTKAKPRQTAAVKAKSTVAESTPAPIIKQRKPVFRIGTWVAVLLLIAVVEFAIYFNREKEKNAAADATPVRAPVEIFSAEDGTLSSIEIKPADGEPVKVARNAEKAWAVVLPIEAEADQGLAEAAAAQVSALQVLNSIDADPEIFGLNKPAFIITLEFASGKTHTLEVGDATPTTSGYYVRLDKNKMMVTDLSGIEALLQLVSAPPYLNTPTPTVLPPTPTLVPTAEASSTPVP